MFWQVPGDICRQRVAGAKAAAAEAAHVSCARGLEPVLMAYSSQKTEHMSTVPSSLVPYVCTT